MIRIAYPEIARGEYKALKTSINYVGGFTSTYNDSTVCVIHNVATSEYEIDLSTLTNHTFNEIKVIVGVGNAKFENNKLIIEGQTSVVLK